MIQDVANRKLRRIVLLIPDVSTVGGVQLRTLKTMRSSRGRLPEYVCLTLRKSKPGAHLSAIDGRLLVYELDPAGVLAAIASWSPDDTVIIFPNNTLRGIDAGLRQAIDKFALIFVGSGQLTYHIQDSQAFVDRAYCDSLNVSKLIVLSEIDKIVYAQFGVHDAVVGFNPVELREVNSYDPTRNRSVGYVGRIDFRTKGADRLIDIARAVKAAGFGPLKVFTTDNRQNSPDFEAFSGMIEVAGLGGDIELQLNKTGLDELFGSLALLVQPSRKEAFGNSILEAYSYGVPVLSSRYAPGPATLIQHGETGLLLDAFDVQSMTDALASVPVDRLMAMSRAAFERHRIYSMENYFSHLEGSGREALQGFSGTNDVRVYPRLAPIEWYGRQYEPLAAAHAELKEKYSKLWFPFLPTPWAKRLVRAVRLIYRLLAEPYFIVRAIFRRLSDLPELSAMATGQRRVANAPDVAEPPSGADGRHPTQSRGANPGFVQSANQPAA